MSAFLRPFDREAGPYAEPGERRIRDVRDLVKKGRWPATPNCTTTYASRPCKKSASVARSSPWMTLPVAYGNRSAGSCNVIALAKEPESITTDEAIDLFAVKLRTPLQVEKHLSPAPEAGYLIGEQPVSMGVAESVLSKQLDDLEPTLTQWLCLARPGGAVRGKTG